MTWDNLKDYKCPDDSFSLIGSDQSHICSRPGCKFNISEIRFKEIINEMYKPRVDEIDRSEWE